MPPRLAVARADPLALVLALVMGVVLAVVGPAGADPEPPAAQTLVRARRFELVDEAGRVRGVVTTDGGPRLVFYDEQGRHRLALALHAEAAPGLELFTAGGSHAVQVRHVNGDSILRLHDTDGRERLALTVSAADSRPAATALAADGSPIASWPEKSQVGGR
jgi:hypothetical protein